MGEKQLAVGGSLWQRNFAGLPELKLQNLFAEINPETGSNFSLVVRPRTSLLATGPGAAPRFMISKPGAFGGDLFVVYGGALYRRSALGVDTAITGSIATTTAVSADCVVGAGYEHLFISAGGVLQLYEGESKAAGRLTVAGTGVASTFGTTLLNVAGVYYAWAELDTVAADTVSDGTVAAPFPVAVGTSDADSLLHMAQAINNTGIRGTTYTLQIVAPHPTVHVIESTHYTDLATNALVVRANDSGVGANALLTQLVGGLSKDSGLLQNASTGTLLAFGSAVVGIGGTYYAWTDSAGLASDTSSTGEEWSPWLVNWGTCDEDAFRNLYHALNLSGAPGKTYTARLTLRNQSVTLNDADVSATAVKVWARMGVTGSAVALSLTGGQPRAYGSVGLSNADDLTITNGIRVTIGGICYRWSFADHLTDFRSDGSDGHPYIVLLGDTNSDSLRNLADAINLTGIPGGQYHALVRAHPDVFVSGDYTGKLTSINLVAKVGGLSGNSIGLSANNAAVMLSNSHLHGGTAVSLLSWSAATLTGGGTPVVAWEHATLTGGGSHALSQVPMSADDSADPDKTMATAGIFTAHVAVMSSFVILLTQNSQRIYFIQPGERCVQGLDFMEAETEPDYLVAAVAVGDTLWLMGQASCEPWYPTGSIDAPFAPITGRVLSHGVVAGTPVKVGNAIFMVGTDSVAYELAGALEPISYPGINEKIRTGIGAGTFSAWAFSFDGHQFYALNIPTLGTAVYNLDNKQWSAFSTAGYGSNWDITGGLMWNSAAVGYDSAGASKLWKLDPSQLKDQGTLSVTWLLNALQPHSGLNFQTHYFLRVAGSRGTLLETPAALTLRWSDNAGATWSTARTISLTSGAYKQDLTYRALGSFCMPGRLYELSSTGGLKRIDGVTVLTDDPPPAQGG